MKFDNVTTTVSEARAVALPLGSSVVTFMVTHCDPRSPEYLRVRSKYTKPVRKLIEVDALPPAKDREISIRVFIEYSVKGWDGVTSNGEPVPYSPDACYDLLSQSPSTFYSLVNEAQDFDNFKPTEGDAGN